MPIYILHDLIESNGKSIKENNLERQHTIPVGTLVELESGERLFVCQHTRDCDGTPLYALTVREVLERHGTPTGYLEEGEVLIDVVEAERLGQYFADSYVRIRAVYVNGYSADSLKVCT